MEIASAILLLLGGLVVFTGALGLVRLPGFFNRLHAAGVIDTLGAWLVLGGLLLISPSLVVAFKVLLIAMLLYFISPVISNAMGRSALDDGVEDPPEDGGGT